MKRNAAFKLLPIATLLLPYAASAQVIRESLSLFNIFVGLMLTTSLLTFGVGFVVWVTRLGTWPTYRTEAVVIFEWAIATLFTLVATLFVVQFFRDHAYAAYVITGLIVIYIVVRIALSISGGGGGEEKAEKH